VIIDHPSLSYERVYAELLTLSVAAWNRYPTERRRDLVSVYVCDVLLDIEGAQMRRVCSSAVTLADVRGTPEQRKSQTVAELFERAAGMYGAFVLDPSSIGRKP
jgi:hypothetical protein